MLMSMFNAMQSGAGSWCGLQVKAQTVWWFTDEGEVSFRQAVDDVGVDALADTEIPAHGAVPVRLGRGLDRLVLASE